MLVNGWLWVVYAQFCEKQIGWNFPQIHGMAEYVYPSMDLVFFVCEFIGWLQTDIKWRLVVQSDWKIKSDKISYHGRMLKACMDLIFDSKIVGQYWILKYIINWLSCILEILI